MPNTNTRPSLFFPALLVALGLSIAGYFIGNTLFKANTSVNTAQVKGLSERVVKADKAGWVIGYTLTADGAVDLAGLYKTSRSQQARIIKLLTDIGFEATEISTDAPTYTASEHRNHMGVVSNVSHRLYGKVMVDTGKVDLVASSRKRISDLIAEGIAIDNQAPTYRYTKLTDIKPEMVKDATENARTAAQEFAKNAGVSVGKIKSARQGSFVIRDFGEEYGNRNKINKSVRVVTTISFYLHD